ncbi:hypothetical protein FQR65_LT11738 [Abscondita terminalis]|nr:hypothetical protein FQR65_LT11738 [Abscondita terminalis]
MEVVAITENVFALNIVMYAKNQQDLQHSLKDWRNALRSRNFITDVEKTKSVPQNWVIGRRDNRKRREYERDYSPEKNKKVEEKPKKLIMTLTTSLNVLETSIGKKAGSHFVGNFGEKLKKLTNLGKDTNEIITEHLPELSTSKSPSTENLIPESTIKEGFSTLFKITLFWHTNFISSQKGKSKKNVAASRER